MQIRWFRKPTLGRKRPLKHTEMSLLFKAENLHAFYGKSHVLHGVNFAIEGGEIVSLLGRNGSGRSTTAKAIMGLVDAEGVLEWQGHNILGKKAFEIAHLGIGYVPENREIFPGLTVHQNLILGVKKKRDNSRWSFDDMYQMFPRLLERQHTEAGYLSGGEQQMLAIGRALVSNASVLLMDEPSEGLAPMIVHEVGEILKKLKSQGFSILLVEQNTSLALQVADDVVIYNTGRVVFSGSANQVREQPGVLQSNLGIF